MKTLLSWQSLVFYIPVAFGALLALGAAFGLAAGGADGEGDSSGDAGDSDADAGTDAGGGDADSALSLLALGKLPLALRLMLLAFSFGGVGLVLGPVIRAVTPGPPLMGDVLAVLVAAVGSLVVSSGTARLLVRRVPLLETETVRRAELVGATGHVVLCASPKAGVVHVHDRRGNLHQVSCRLAAGEAPLPAGTEVLLVDYDERCNAFLAVKNPIAGG